MPLTLTPPLLMVLYCCYCRLLSIINGYQINTYWLCDQCLWKYTQSSE